MTIIAAVADQLTGERAIAADLAMSDSSGTLFLGQSKLVRVADDLVLGIAGGGPLYRWGRQHAAAVWAETEGLRLGDWDRLDHLAAAWYDWCRAAGAMTEVPGLTVGMMLACTPSGIAQISRDGGVHRVEDYICVGGGDQFGFGAIHALRATGVRSAAALATAAVEAAIQHCTSCAGGPVVEVMCRR